MLFGPMGMVVGPTPLPSATVKHTHRAETRRSNPFSEHSSVQADICDTRCDTSAPAERQHRPRTPIKLAPARARTEEEMNTANSLLLLPPTHPSYQLAFFLRNTCPDSDKVSSRQSTSQRLSYVPRRFNIFRSRDVAKHPPAQQSEPLLRDYARQTTIQDGIQGVEPKVSMSGARYLSIVPSGQHETEEAEEAPRSSLEVLESRVSVLFSDSMEEWNNIMQHTFDSEQDRNVSGQTVRIVTSNETPVRPAASSPPSAAGDSTLGSHDANDKTTRWRHVEMDTALHSNPRSPRTDAFDTTSALPPIPPPSPSLQHKMIDRQKRFSRGSPARAISHSAVPNTSLRRHPLPQSHFNPSIRSSSSPGPPPKNPLRLSQGPASLDSYLKVGVEATQSSPEKTSPEVEQLAKFKSVPYHNLPSPDAQRSSGSTGSSSQTHISTGRKWIASRARAHEVPVVNVVIRSDATPPRTRNVLRRARAGPPAPAAPTPREAGRTIINKRMSINMSERRLSASTLGSVAGFKPSHIPVAATASAGARPRSARMPKRPKSQRALKPRPARTPSPPPKGTPKGQGASPMTLNSALPSPPPKRDLPPTPKQMAKGRGHSRTGSGSSRYSVNSSFMKATPPRPLRMRKTKAPKQLDIGRLVGQFPSPPSSAKSTGRMHIISQMGDSVSAPFMSGFGNGVIAASTGPSTADPNAFIFGQSTQPRSADEATRESDAVFAQHTQPDYQSTDARLAALEYQNKMLEAALRAVLSTGGAMSSSSNAFLSLAAALGALGGSQAPSVIAPGFSHPASSAPIRRDQAPTEEGAERVDSQQALFPDGHDVSSGSRLPSVSFAARQAAADRDQRLVSAGSQRSRGSGRSSDRSGLDEYLETRGRMDSSSVDFA